MAELERVHDDAQARLHAAVGEAAGLRDDSAELRTLCTDSAALREENALLAAQVDADAATIRQLRGSGEQLQFDRARYDAALAEAAEARDDAATEAGLLERHAQELRKSNAVLAAEVADLGARVAGYEREDHKAWFTRTGLRDAAKAQHIRDQQAEPQQAQHHHQAEQQQQHQQRQQPQPHSPPPPPTDGGYEDISSTVFNATGLDDDLPRRHAGGLSGSDSRSGFTSADQSPLMSPEKTFEQHASDAGGSSFRTIRQLRQARDGPPDAGRGVAFDDGDAAASRSTPPLAVEAVYGEKGRGDEQRMYLVKYRGVEAEQWCLASAVDPGCPAVALWRHRQRGVK
jgi:hypothetical protein